MRKPTYCKYENKGANVVIMPDQGLCYRNIDAFRWYNPSTLLIRKFSVVVQPCLCRTWLETTMIGFVMLGLVCDPYILIKFVWHSLSLVKMSNVMRKPTFYICEKTKTPVCQLRGNGEADQRLCFRYLDRNIPLLSKSENSSL